jgi:hypothetical protein
MTSWARNLDSKIGVGDFVAVPLTATIASGQSLSTAVDTDCGAGRRIAGIIFPASWDASDISFQGSVDGTNFYDLYLNSTELVIASAGAANRFTSCDGGGNVTLYARYIKVRSGTSGSPTNQNADRIITVLAN